MGLRGLRVRRALGLGASVARPRRYGVLTGGIAGSLLFHPPQVDDLGHAWFDPAMLTLLMLIVVVLLVSAGQFSVFDLDFSGFPGGTAGVLVLVVVVLLLTRRF